MTDKEKEAKTLLDKIINKSRLHLYKPIQVAEVLYKDRLEGIDFDDTSSFVNPSKQWRDAISHFLVKSVCSSSDSYQKALFRSEMPIEQLKVLSDINRRTRGGVEAYIYRLFENRFNTMVDALNYCSYHNQTNFQIQDFLNIFFSSKELKKSVDKIYEIVVYALFSALVDCLNIQITLSSNEAKSEILKEFSDFAEQVIGLSEHRHSITIPANIHRMGVTNAADGGLDMWSSFGLAIQIKHIDLDEESAKKIVESITADRIVIVCRDADKNVIISLLNQIGWKARIQGVVTEKRLILWYEKALRGKYSDQLGNKIINIILSQIQREFPSADNSFTTFWNSRMYKIESIPAGWT